MEKISVIVPVYNPGIHFVKCLNSIVGQTYTDLEIILIDDGSTDGSSELCDRYAAEDSRIKVFHQKSSGVSRARNVGLLAATGDFVHFPDSDDYLESDTYEYLMNIIDREKCSAVAFEHYVTYPDHETAHQLDENYYGQFYGAEIQRHLFCGSQFCCNKLFKKGLLQGLRFREDIFRGEDTLFSAAALLKAEKVYFDSRPLYHYVQSEESACRGKFRLSQLSVMSLYEAYKSLYESVYPEMYPTVCLFLQEVLISLYYDMWADEEKNAFSAGKKQVYKQIAAHKKETRSSDLMTVKQKIKLRLFLLSPYLFCRTHKIIHNL